MILDCKEIHSNGKHFYYINGRRISKSLYLNLYNLKEDIDCVYTLSVYGKIKHYCSLHFKSDYAIKSVKLKLKGILKLN